ncbi:MAG TPA: TIGR02281 family clan AA aspartic protease [Xanthobacteraceae bacterium]|nr:TIGR02281 family clan AA aspartic protease [Xanthobacteraceae bacterium]
MRGILILASIMIGLGLLMAQVADHMTASTPAFASISTENRIERAQPSGRSIHLTRDRRGHFHAEGRVSGRRLTFMVDTGATVVALTERAAAEIGIAPARGSYTVNVSTANGSVKAARAKLAALEIGPLIVHDVDALVLPEGALSENLLGLSYLSRLKRFEYAEGRLVLEQ